jgi:hypothetical protein
MLLTPRLGRLTGPSYGAGRPPSVQLALRPDSSGPSAERLLSGDRHRGKWVRQEGGTDRE